MPHYRAQNQHEQQDCHGGQPQQHALLVALVVVVVVFLVPMTFRARPLLSLQLTGAGVLAGGARALVGRHNVALLPSRRPARRWRRPRRRWWPRRRRRPPGRWRRSRATESTGSAFAVQAVRKGVLTEAPRFADGHVRVVRLLGRALCGGRWPWWRWRWPRWSRWRPRRLQVPAANVALLAFAEPTVVS